MYDTDSVRARPRRRRPWWAGLLLAPLCWPAVALAGPADESPAEPAAAEVGAEIVTAGDHPTRAPAHADCGLRMPLYLHRVERGEHLGIIAGRYGVHTDELVALNPSLENPDLIRPGDEIRVCPEIFPRLTKTVEHEVQPGETLTAIAGQYGLSVPDLLEQQGGAITDPNHLRVGQVVTMELDGGLVPDFLPPPPQKRKRSRKSGGKRTRVGTALSPSKHIHIKRPRAAYGTDKTIRLFEQAIGNYTRRHRGAHKVLVGDLSRKGGGKFSPHVSHRTGRDIDLGYVIKGGYQGRTRFGGVTDETLDVAKTWSLIKSFIDTGEVVYVFVDYRIQAKLYEHAKARGMSQRKLDELFQYPRGRKKARGIIRHWPSHRHHFHVRFRG